jgi:arginase
VTVLRVPHFLGEYLPELDLPLHGDDVIVPDLPAGDTWVRLAALLAPVADAVAAAAGRGERPVVVSGDCTTAFGTVAGLQRAGIDPAVVWFDAHGDVQTLETTTSGFVGGFALRMLLGYQPEWIASRLGLRPVPEHQVMLAGARDLDPPEVAYLESSAIRRAQVVDVASAALPEGPLYVHLDLDVIDPIGVPGLRYPAPGGPNCAQVTAALGMLLATGRVAAVGIACTWHPGHQAAAAVSDRLESVLAAGQ